MLSYYFNVNMTTRYFIGIDPDSDKSGIGIWDSWTKKFLKVESMDFWDLADFLYDFIFKEKNLEDFGVFVVVEAGWLVAKANFHVKSGALRREKQAMNIGQNLQTGKLIERFLIRNNVPYRLTEPLGTKGFDQDRFKKFTGWQETTNQDNRDAALLVFQMS